MVLLSWENRFWPRHPCPDWDGTSEKSLVPGPSPGTGCTALIRPGSGELEVF